jgi:hypothetical protein
LERLKPKEVGDATSENDWSALETSILRI